MKPINDAAAEIIKHSKKICTIIRKKDGQPEVQDCEGNKVNYLDCEKKDVDSKDKNKPKVIARQPNAGINKKYRENRNGLQNADHSNVWVLIGKKDDNGSPEVIQVGQTLSLERQIEELNVNRNAVIFNDKKNVNLKKYGGLLDTYNELSFYEVNLDDYFDDNEFKNIFNTEKFNDNAIFYYVKSLFVEGKIAALTGAEKWHHSGKLDKFVYELFKKESSQKTGDQI